MRVLVTGGAGALGVNLLRYLRGHREWEIRSLDVAPLDGADLGHVEVVDGDIRDREVVAGAVRHVDVVVNAAAALPSYGAATSGRSTSMAPRRSSRRRSAMASAASSTCRRPRSTDFRDMLLSSSATR